MARAAQTDALLRELEAGNVPLRVTHNDTKMDNVLLDEKTGRGVCIIDLDTVMPGLSAWDFGDAVRTGANTAGEDERDLSRVAFSLPMFKALCERLSARAGRRADPAGAGSAAPGGQADDAGMRHALFDRSSQRGPLFPYPPRGAQSGSRTHAVSSGGMHGEELGRHGGNRQNA